MRHIQLFLLVLLSIVLVTVSTIQVTAQNKVSKVFYKQGQIQGTLPYGKFFSINGSTKYLGGYADKVSISIWETGNRKYRRTNFLPPPTPEKVAAIVNNPENLVISSSWFAARASDTANFELYINQPLQFRTQYLIQMRFSGIITLSGQQINRVLSEVKTSAITRFNTQSFIDQSDIEEILGTAIKRETDLLLISEQINKDDSSIEHKIPTIKSSIAQNINNAIGRYAAKKAALTLYEEQLLGLDDAASIAAIKNEISVFKESLVKLEGKLEAELEALAPFLRQEIAEYTISGSNEASVTELESIQVSSNVGFGVVGLNVLSRNNEEELSFSNSEFDGLGYVGLKFYFLPVDKRIAQPYLTDKAFINKLAFNVGFTTTGNLNYRGDDLKQILFVTPVVGFSYDLNRYISLDINSIFFKQQSLSPVNNAEKFRVAPVIGLSFDADIFNRFKTLFSGETYNVNPDSQ